MQNEERQVQELEKQGIDKWFNEKISAKDTERPELKKMIDFAREGDTIFIKDFSRLARSTRDLLSLIETFEAKKIKLISLNESLDTSTPTGRLMLTMIGAMNEFERNNMLERQREGIAIAKREGKYKGRKEIVHPANWEEVYKLWKSRELTGTRAMEMLGLKRNTFYKLVKDYEESKKA